MTSSTIEAKSTSPTTNVTEQDDDFHTEQVATVGFGHFVHDTFSAFLPPLLPILQERLGTGYAGAGSLIIFTQLPSILTPFIGYLADRVSLRYFVILAPAVTATLMSSMGLVNDYFSLVLLLLAAGVSIAAFHAPAPAMIGRVSGSRIGTGMSIFMASGELGRTVGPLVAVGAVAWFGLEGIWRLAGIGWLVSLFLFWRLRQVAARPNRSDQDSLRTMLPQARRVFPVLVWIMLPKAFLIVSITAYLPIFVNDELQSNLWLAAGALTILEMAGVVGALFTGTLSDRIGRRRMLFILLSVAPILMAIFVLGPAWVAIPMLIGLGLTAISPTPVMLAVVQDNFPDNRAMANGIFMFLNFLTRALCIWLVGAFADRYGLTNAFLASTVLALFSIPAVFWLPNPPSQPSDEVPVSA